MPPASADRQARLDAMHTSGRAALYDGAKGVFLSPRLPDVGKPPSDLTEWLNLLAPETVRQAHRDYVQAGSDVIQTNSFNGNRFQLEHRGLASRAEEVNLLASQIAREAAGDEGRSGRKRYRQRVEGLFDRTLRRGSGHQTVIAGGRVLAFRQRVATVVLNDIHQADVAPRRVEQVVATFTIAVPVAVYTEHLQTMIGQASARGDGQGPPVEGQEPVGRGVVRQLAATAYP